MFSHVSNVICRFCEYAHSPRPYIDMSPFSVCRPNQLCAQHVFALKMWAFMPNRERVSGTLSADPTRPQSLATKTITHRASVCLCFQKNFGKCVCSIFHVLCTLIRDHVSAALITHRIKEDSLRTFLFAFASASTAKVQAFGALSLLRLARYRNQHTHAHTQQYSWIFFYVFDLSHWHSHGIISHNNMSKFLPDSTYF